MLSHYMRFADGRNGTEVFAPILTVPVETDEEFRWVGAKSAAPHPSMSLIVYSYVASTTFLTAIYREWYPSIHPSRGKGLQAIVRFKIVINRLGLLYILLIQYAYNKTSPLRERRHLSCFLALIEDRQGSSPPWWMDGWISLPIYGGQNLLTHVTYREERNNPDPHSTRHFDRSGIIMIKTFFSAAHTTIPPRDGWMDGYHSWYMAAKIYLLHVTPYRIRSTLPLCDQAEHFLPQELLITSSDASDLPASRRYLLNTGTSTPDPRHLASTRVVHGQKDRAGRNKLHRNHIVSRAYPPR